MTSFKMAPELHAHHRLMLLLATLFSVLSMVPVVEPPSMRFLLPACFVIVSLLPRKIWSKTTRFVLFSFLVAFTLMQAGGFKDGIGTSLLVAVMLVKYVEMKTVRDAAAMSLFNTMAPFIGFLQEQDPVIFLLGVVSISFTLCLLQMLHTQPVKHSSFLRAWGHHLKILARTSFTVLPLALMVYALAPRFDNPLWGNYRQGSHGGVKDEMKVAQWDEMFTDLSTAFRVRFHGTPPPKKDMYFRGITMWTFDGEKWTTEPKVSGAVRQSPDPRGDRLKRTYNYTISYDIRDKRFYTLDYPVAIPSGSMRYTDDTFMAQRGRLPQKPITLTSAPAQPSSLTEAERTSALQLPDGNPRIRAWALEQRQRFQNDRDFAVFVEGYLRTQYLYNLAPMPVGRDAVDDFFFTTKEGFCAHFSSAFTVIMRASGIPSRVVNGYFASEVSEFGDFYRVRQADAHAWSEVWLDDRWVRFEPTSAVGSLSIRNGKEWYSRLMNIAYATVDWTRDAWERYVLYYDRSTQEKAMNMVKQSFTQEGLSSLMKNTVRHAGEVITTFLALFFFFTLFRIIKKKRLSRSWASDVEKVLQKMGEGNPAEDWMLRAERIARRLPDDRSKDFLSFISVLHNFAYDPASQERKPPLHLLKSLQRIQRLYRP